MVFHNIPKKVLMFIFFLLLISSVNALSDKNFALYSGESIDFEGYNIYILQGANFGDMMIKVDGEVDFIDFSGPVLFKNSAGKTEEILYFDNKVDLFNYAASNDLSIKFNRSQVVRFGDLKLELKRVCISVAQDDCGRINPDTLDIEPRYVFYASLQEPKIDVSTSYEKTSVIPGEYIKVTTTIENEGDVPLKNFVYEENFPPGVTLKTNKVILKTDEGIMYKIPYLEKGKSQTFSYSLSLTEPLEYSLKGTYSYSYNDQFFEKTTSNAKISLKEISSLSFQAPSAVELDEEKDFKIKLENKIDEEIEYLIFLTIPQNITLEDMDKDFKGINDSVYELKGMLDEKNTLEKTFSASFPHLGDYMFSLKSQISYLVDNPPVYDSKTISVTEEFDDFIMGASPSATNILEGDTITAEVHFIGDEGVTIDDLEINITGDPSLNITPQYYQENTFSEEDGFKNYYFDISFPKINATKDYTLTFDAKAKVSRDRHEDYVKKIQDKITIKAYTLRDSISISRTANPNPVLQGGLTQFKLSAKNNLDEKRFSQIYAYDIIPQDYFFKDVMSENIFSLHPREEKMIYSYQLKAPYFVNESNSEVTTILDTGYYTANFSTDLSTYVDLEEPQIDISYNTEGDLKSGDRFRMSATASNTGDIDAYELKLSFPLFENADLLLPPKRTFHKSIPLLETGESVDYFIDYMAKNQGSYSGYEISSYKDEYGNLFIFNSTTLDIEISAGNSGCFVTVEKELLALVENGTFYGKQVPFNLRFENHCSQSAEVQVVDPSIAFTLKGKEIKDFEYEKFYYENFSGSLGNIYSYYYDEEVHVSITNSIDTYFEINSSDYENASTLISSNSNSGNSASSGSDVETTSSQDEVSLGAQSSFGIDKIAYGLFGIFFMIIILMIVAFGLLKYFRNKKLKKTSDKNKQISSSTENVPGVGSGIGDLESYINDSRLSSTPEIQIQQNLLLKGWSKDVVDAFMKRGDR